MKVDLRGLVDEVCHTLRLVLEEAVRRNLAEGILLSGGLDTSVLAFTASKFIPLKAFTVAFQGGPAPDVEYATLMADKLKIRHSVYYFREDELHGAINKVIQAMKLFDPMEVRNSVTIYIGLKFAKESGVNSVMTGDGCDELFAGYSFLFGLEKELLELELQKLWDVMHFSSIPLAGALGMEAKLPYLDPDFKSYAMELDSEYKIRRERGQIYGKWIVRKAFEGVLPDEVVWRVKTPIERGSGTSILPSLFEAQIPDAEFSDKKGRYLDEDEVVIRDKEQLFYYEVYRSAVGVPHPSDPAGRTCPQCNSNVPKRTVYCRTCGAYPI